MNFEPRILENISELNTHRPGSIIGSVKGVSMLTNGIVCNPVSIGGRSFILGVSDSREMNSNYLDWRFKTYNPDFTAMYYERWKPFEKDTYFLERVYFHVYKLNRSAMESKEYILLHCDAAEPDGTEHSEYKKVPHLHICCAEEPIPHAHFSLYKGARPSVLDSLEMLNAAIKDSIEMIDNQILLRQA